MFNLLTFVFVIVSIIAVTKAVRYETKAVDNFLSEIRHIIHDRSAQTKTNFTQLIMRTINPL